VNSPRQPWWRQATALVSLSAGGAITGFAFVPSTADHVASPAGLPVTLTALDHAARPARSDDSAVRSAIVSVTNYYLRMAQGKTPAEMEALIWQHDSADGADHGESCAAFASMTLQLAAQLMGRQSWVTGGSSYPWPLQDWADVRVDANPASPGITSVLQDAQAHHRWHPLGDGYEPLPGDWVLFDGHVEVVTKYSGGVLYTVGGDSLPNFSVNAHEYPGPLAAQGVAGFVSNGDLPADHGSAAGTLAAATPAAGTRPASAAGASTPARAPNGSHAHAAQQAGGQSTGALAAIPGAGATVSDTSVAAVQADGATIPGVPVAAAVASWHRPATSGGAGRQAAANPAARHQATDHPAGSAGPGTGQPAARQPTVLDAAIPGVPVTASARDPARPLSASVPATPPSASDPATPPSASYSRHQPAPAPASSPGTAAQLAFISHVAPGAIAAQRTYGVPAAVTIAQAIDESAWGQSALASQDHNLFGIKGLGPAGSDSFPTREYQNGQWVTTTAQFRVYDDVAQSIDDHGKLLATSRYYAAAMADRQAPDGFARALTGVYATNPDYGANLISLMHRYNLYRFDAGAQGAGAAAAAAAPAVANPAAAAPSAPADTAAAQPAAAARSASAPSGAARPARATAAPRTPGRTAKPGATPSARPSVSPQVATPQPTAPGATARPPAAKPAATAPAQTPSATAWPPTAEPATSATPAAEPAAPGAATRPAHTVPHPFATPQPSGPAPAPVTPPNQAAIPGIPSGPGSTSAHTSAQLRPSPGAARLHSSSDTQVVADLAAVFRAEAPAEKPPATVAADHSPTAEPAPTANSPAAKARADWALPDRSAAGQKPRKRKGSTPKARKAAARYQPQMPAAVRNAFLATARKPLARAEFIYRDVAGSCGISWKLLAACDWMQCEAHPRYSPVQGEKLGTVNTDGTVYWTKSEALTQCATDLVALAGKVYQIDLAVPVELSVLELARVFAAFRWGGLLKLHNTSAMEFPFSVQGLTEQHTSMRWPKIAEPNAPDRPGARFRGPFGAVPVVLSLNYPATV